MAQSFSHFKKYAEFILHEQLDAVIRRMIQKARTLDVPLLKLLAHLSDEELFQMSRQGLIEDLLTPVIEENPFEKTRFKIEEWKANHLIVPKDQIRILDVTVIYKIRKSVLIEFLQFYPSSKEETLDIVLEIEEFFRICTDLALEAYEEIQRGELKAKEEVLSGILSNIPVIVTRVNKEGYITQSMGSGLKLLGLQDKNLAGANIFENYPDANNVRKALKGQAVSFSGSAKTTDGGVRHYQSYFFPEKDGTLGFSIDITERVIAQEKIEELNNALEVKVAERTKALFESEERFRFLAEFMPQMVWTGNSDGYIDYANEKWMSYTGLDMEATRANGWMDALHPDDVKPTMAAWKNALEKGVMYDVVCRYKRASDGMYRWHIGRALPLKNEQGEIIKWFGTSTDIHDQKEAEESLRMQARVLESMEEGVSVSSEEGYIVYTNPAEDAMFGYEPGELIGKHVTVQNAYAPEVNERIVGDVIGQLKTKGIWMGEWSNIRKDGTVFTSYSQITSLSLGDKNLFVCVQRDVTEEKKNKEALLAKNEELIKTNNDLDNFIYTASHDLKAPVSNIEGLMSALSDTLKSNNMFSEDVERIVKMIEGSVKRFQGTIRELTEISKIQKTLAEDVLELDVCETVEDLKSDIQRLIQESQAVIHLDVSRCPAFHFSKANFRSVVYNLITNGIKYRSPDRQPELQISSWQEEAFSVLQVRDNGLGIKKEHQDKIFTMFKRLHDHVEGTGVGLYIVKRIIENTGGRIEVESEEGQGSVFRVYFKR